MILYSCKIKRNTYSFANNSLEQHYICLFLERMQNDPKSARFLPRRYQIVKQIGRGGMVYLTNLILDKEEVAVVLRTNYQTDYGSSFSA